MTEVTQKLIAHNGKYIVLPPGMSSQDFPSLEIPKVSVVDIVQKYPLGTKFVSGDRVYRYCLANGTCNPEVGAYKAKKTNTNAVAPTQSTTIDTETGLAPGVVGSRQVTVTIDTEIGHLTTGVLSVDELAGGYVVIGNGSAQHPQMRCIVSHPALATAGGSLTLTLDEPLITVVTVGTTTIELMECPFYNLLGDNAGDGYVTFIGIPACVVADTQCFWLQTWGPCWITSNSNTCYAANSREIFFVANGSVVSGDALTYAGAAYQRAGVALDMSGSAASNAPMVLLQIMP